MSRGFLRRDTLLRDVIEKLRRSKDLNQEEFALALEMSKASVQNWESGRKDPRARAIRKMKALVPGFADELERAAENRRKAKNLMAEPISAVTDLLDQHTRKRAQELAKNENKSLAQYCAELVTLAIRSRPDVPRRPAFPKLSAEEREERNLEQLEKERKAHARHGTQPGERGSRRSKDRPSKAS